LTGVTLLRVARDPLGQVSDFHVFYPALRLPLRALLVSVMFALFQMGGEFIEAEGI
jgi:hypothetical protein